MPANTTTGTGLFTATLDTSTNVFSYDLTFSGLTSTVNNGHIHGPAAVGVNSGTTINFNTLAGATFSWAALPDALPLWLAAAALGGLLGTWLGIRLLPVPALRYALAAVLCVAAGKLILT